MVYSLVSHVENIGCSPNSDWRIPSSPSPLEGIHWRPPSIGSDSSRFQFFFEDHFGFSVKNRLEVPRVGVEGNFIYFPGKHLRTYFYNSRHLIGTTVLLSILLLNNQIPYICHCLHFTNLYQYSHQLVI